MTTQFIITYPEQKRYLTIRLGWVVFYFLMNSLTIQSERLLLANTEVFFMHNQNSAFITLKTMKESNG